MFLFCTFATLASVWCSQSVIWVQRLCGLVKTVGSGARGQRVTDGAQISESPSVCPTLTDPTSSPANTRLNTIKAIITHPQVHGLQFSPPRDMGIRAIRIKFPFWAQPGKFITELSGNLSPNYGTQDCYRGLPTFRTLWGFGQEKLTGDRNYLRFASCKTHLKSASTFYIWGQEFDSRKKGSLDCPEY